MLGRGSSPNSTGTNQQMASNPAASFFGMLNPGQAQPGAGGTASNQPQQPPARGPYGGAGGWTIDPIDSWQQQQQPGGGIGMLQPKGPGAGNWGGGMIGNIGNIGNLGGGAYRGPVNAPAQGPNANFGWGGELSQMHQLGQVGPQARQGGYAGGIGQMFSQMHPQAQQALHSMNPQVLQQLHQAGMLHPELMGHLNSMRGGGGMRSPMSAY